jgi:predicted DNA-binding WGR domain protein
MQPVHLHRVNAEAKMARFYHVDIAPTLFGEVSVLRSWGRIGTHGRTNIETCVTPEEAETTAARTLRQKAQRGYVAAFQIHMADLPG